MLADAIVASLPVAIRGRIASAVTGSVISVTAILGAIALTGLTHHP
jgi:hypothetical protein